MFPFNNWSEITHVKFFESLQCNSPYIGIISIGETQKFKFETVGKEETWPKWPLNSS